MQSVEANNSRGRSRKEEGKEGKKRFSLGNMGENTKIKPERKAEPLSPRVPDVDLILWIRRSHQRD